MNKTKTDAVTVAGTMPALRRILGVCLVVIFVFLGVGDISGVYTTASQHFQGEYPEKAFEDFLSFYAAGRSVWEGKGHSLYNPDVIEQKQESLVGHPVGADGKGLPFFNPPFVAGLLAPLTTLPLNVFSAVYLAILLLMLVSGGYLVQKLVPIRGPVQRGLYWFGFLTFLPVCWLLLEEQLTMFVFLGWLGFAVLESRGEHRWSGVALVLALVKPQSIIVLLALLVWKRRWRTLGSFGLTATPLVLASILIAGPSALYEYPRLLLDTASWHGRGINATGMFSWISVPAEILGTASPPLLTYLPFTLLTVAGVAFAWRGVEWQPQSPRFLLLCAVTFLAAMLINPHFYLQDVTLICVPLSLAGAWRHRSGGSIGMVWIVAAATWIFGRYGPLIQHDHGITVLTLWMAFLLLAGIVEAGRAREAKESPVSSSPSLEAAAA